MRGHLNVTKFMRHLNVTNSKVTNSIMHLHTHRLRGKMRIKSSTVAEVPISCPPTACMRRGFRYTQYAYMYVYIYNHVRTYTYVYVYVYNRVHTYTCVCSYIYHVSISCPPTACMRRGFRYTQYAYIYVYIYNHVRTYTYVYVYVYNHVHTYTCVCSYMYHISISCPPIACMRFGCRYIHERTPIIYAPMCTHSVIYTYINLHVLLSVHIYNHKIM